MNDQYFTTKPACLDRSPDARLYSNQDGDRVAAGKPWRRPELKVLAVEETKHSLAPGKDGSGTALHGS